MVSSKSSNASSKPTRSQRRTQKMKDEFPELTREMLWNRKRHDGFATLPRTMPLAMKVIDAKSEKGHPAGHTLFCLWARAMDHPYIVIDRPKIYAMETGLIGERAESTWKKRMDKLVKLGFILTKEGTSGVYHHVVLLNPNVAVSRLNDRGQVQDATWAFFKERAEEIGALPEITEAQDIIKEKRRRSPKRRRRRAANKRSAASRRLEVSRKPSEEGG